MDTAGALKKSLTPSQRKALAARGNVLVMAGAGTGKTHTLVQRCLDLVRNERVSLAEMLIVTFTEAAATEVRERLRQGLQQAAADSPSDPHLPEQLALFDAAHIGTLHSFCFRLVREHFHALDLDPRLTVLDEAQARLLSDEILEDQFQSHYKNDDQFSLSVQDIITVYGNGRDDTIRSLALRLYHYIQTRADADGWLARQIAGFSSVEPLEWRKWFLKALQDWRNESAAVLRSLGGENTKAAECLEILERFPTQPGMDPRSWSPLLGEIAAADDPARYPSRQKMILRKPLEWFFEDANFLGSLLPNGGNESPDPLREDWEWSRGHMKTLLLLAKEFAEEFSARKRADGVLDFHDLEQFAIKLLWGSGTIESQPLPAETTRLPSQTLPTPVASHWRDKFRFIFVDEYQDINAAQDKIISALGGDNRFLVGDVKQSIYRFRLADPTIFRNYAKNPEAWKAKVIPLADNFRSREGLLNFVNSLFERLMTEEIGGVIYDDQSKLKFASAQTRVELSGSKIPAPQAELLLREKKRAEYAHAGETGDPLADLQEAELEALMVASRLRTLKESGHLIWDDSSAAPAQPGNKFRPARWSDFVVLLRSPGGKAEVYAKQFERAGVPLHVERGGFYDTTEISDLLSLLQLADNPLQDVPCVAVLRSPMVGCSLDELAEIRLVASGHFWFALKRAAAAGSSVTHATRPKLEKFLRRFEVWRELARVASLSECLERILIETHYDDWLLSRPRGAQRRANVRRFLHLAEQFDAFQRQGLFRFLKFVEAQREIEAEPDVAPMPQEDAVRLMSIHQSKGLEFPVVALVDLGKTFNEQDLRGEIILDEQFGLCPRVKPPSAGGRYPSLAYWLARKNQRRELRGEELRLLYVALTRARDTLILSGSVSAKKMQTAFSGDSAIGPRDIASANSCMDWVGIWFAMQGLKIASEGPPRQSPLLQWRIVDDQEFTTDLAAPAGAESAAPWSQSRDEANLNKINEILNWKYSFDPATRRTGKTSVTALRREAADDEAEQRFGQPFPRNAKPGKKASRLPGAGDPSHNPRTATWLNAADTGVAHHKFLQYFAFETATDLQSFVAEALRLEREAYLTAEEAKTLDLEGIAEFWASEIGEKIRANGQNVRRELAFTASFKPRELDEIFGKEPSAGLDDEIVVVQGVADLALLLPEEIQIVDFKTDEVTANDLPERIEFYSPQLKLYARALEKIYCRPVRHRLLHFLAARRTARV